MKRNIQGAIFDMDGTVLDSMPLWRNYRVKFLAARELSADAELVDRLQAMTVRESAQAIKDHFSLSEPMEEILADMLKHVRNFYTEGVPVKPHLIPFLEDLKSRGVKICMASATDAELVDLALTKSGIRPYFDAIFSTKTIGRSKKYPDIYLLAQQYMGTPTYATWVFEDAFYALKTAASAGFLTVGVHDEDRAHREEETRALADIYFPDFSVYGRYF